MKKIPTLYTKNSKGRYEEYRIPEHDISNTLYGKVNGRYEPVCMRIFHELDEGVWVVTKQPSICSVILLPLHPGIKLGYLVNGC